MPPSFDRGDATLLCEEDEASIFDDGEDSSIAEFDNAYLRRGGPVFVISTCNAVSPPLMDVESVIEMMEKEGQYQPNHDYLKRLKNSDWNFDARREAIDLIGKLHSHFGFGPSCACLAINYMDRFLAAYDLPERNSWTISLLSVAVLSLAAKMEETDVPLSMDLQMDSKIVFEPRTIQRMELLILSTLKWRMNPITPFSYIDHFLLKINGDSTLSNNLILQSIQIILGIIKGIDFLGFRSSEIAAAVCIAVVGRTKFVDIKQAISALNQQMDQSRVINCMKLVQDSAFMGTSDSIFSLPQSPIGVLDATFFSFTSDDLAFGSCMNSPEQSSPSSKRRKLCEFCQA